MGTLWSISSRLYGQEPTATPAAGEAEVERVIVTGSNIPTAEEVRPNPVDTYTTQDLEKLGARTATQLVQRIPAITGFSNTENNNNGDGRTEINLRGLFPKETLVLVDGKKFRWIWDPLGRDPPFQKILSSPEPKDDLLGSRRNKSPSNTLSDFLQLWKVAD